MLESHLNADSTKHNYTVLLSTGLKKLPLSIFDKRKEWLVERAITGNCPGLRYDVICFNTSPPCLNIETAAAFLWKMGNKKFSAGGKELHCWEAWESPHEIKSSFSRFFLCNN